jgi:phosphomannomutase
MVGMAYVLQLMAATGKSVSELVNESPRYEMVKTKFECRREDADKAVAALKQAYASEKIDTQDGIRIDWPDSWLHARPSNTEPIMRVFAEAPDPKTAQSRIDAARGIIDKALGNEPESTQVIAPDKGIPAPS